MSISPLTIREFTYKHFRFRVFYNFFDEAYFFLRDIFTSEHSYSFVPVCHNIVLDFHLNAYSYYTLFATKIPISLTTLGLR